jgi:hypothetical protein
VAATVSGQKWVDQIEARKAELDDPDLRAMCDTFIRHVKTEWVGDLDATFATMVPEPVYRNWGGFTNRTGPVEHHLDAIKQIYGTPVERFGYYPPADMDIDRFLVSRDAIVMDGTIRMMSYGGDLRALGEDVKDDSWYVVETRIALFFPFKEGLMTGEDAYIDHLASIEEMSPEDVERSWFRGETSLADASQVDKQDEELVTSERTFRRIVTGRTDDGGGRILADDRMQLDEHGIGRIWGTDGPPSLVTDGVIANPPDWFPPVGGCRVTLFSVAPQAGDPGAVRSDGPAPWGHEDVHASDTVDVIHITSGTAWIQHPDGEEVRLDAGDVIVQHGTMHGWVNHSDKPAKGIAFVVGATPDP